MKTRAVGTQGAIFRPFAKGSIRRVMVLGLMLCLHDIPPFIGFAMLFWVAGKKVVEVVNAAVPTHMAEERRLK